jgi:hypothetical protein
MQTCLRHRALRPRLHTSSKMTRASLALRHDAPPLPFFADSATSPRESTKSPREVISSPCACCRVSATRRPSARNMAGVHRVWARAHTSNLTCRSSCPVSTRRQPRSRSETSCAHTPVNATWISTCRRRPPRVRATAHAAECNTTRSTGTPVSRLSRRIHAGVSACSTHICQR